MRTSITGVFDFPSPSRVFVNTAAMCHVTHADPRCLASCVLIAELISSILRGADISTPAATDATIEAVLAQTLVAVPLKDHQAEFVDYCQVRSRDLALLELDNLRSGIGYTNKTMAAGLYGLRSVESFEVTMTRLVREAGDADTNGAVCGAMLGARLGYAGLPAAWLRSMPHTNWLAAKLVPFLRLVLERADALKGVPEPEAFAKAAGHCVIS
jgi:ADP-ribosylglycohydrolase